MPAEHVDIAEAVKDSLNGAALSKVFTATRPYLPRIDRATTGLLVYVWPDSETVELRARSKASVHDYLVNVAVRNPIAVDTDTHNAGEIDDMVLLMEEIKDHLRDAGNMNGAALIEIEHEPIFDERLLEESHEFRAEAVFTYRKIRT